jgi:hypothetical protein
LQPGQARLLNDDRAGRALDHLHRADRASLLTALVLRAVREFDIDLSEQHQDTTTVTFSGEYAHQTRTRPPSPSRGSTRTKPGHDHRHLLGGVRAPSRELRRFHDPLPPVAEQVLALLGVDPTAYGIA